MKTILVYYSNKILSEKEVRSIKLYAFNTNSEIEVGDVLESSSYTTKMVVAKVLDEKFKYYNNVTGDLSNNYTSTSMREIVELEIKDDNYEVVYAKKVEL